jgi:ABC transporter substrate binding protein
MTTRRLADVGDANGAADHPTRPNVAAAAQLHAPRFFHATRNGPYPQTYPLSDHRRSSSRTIYALQERSGCNSHRPSLRAAASSVSEIDSAFAEAKRHGANALMVSSDPFLHSRRAQIVALTAQYGIAAISSGREWVTAGGLISYGNSIRDAYRRAGLQTGRLLRGVKPTDLPIDRSTRFELAINLTTAKALGLTVPDKLLVVADEVIE